MARRRKASKLGGRRRHRLEGGPGIARSLRSHPVLCLLLLSPGIPEYLSSSSPLNAIILNPPMFLFQLLANLGLYGPGVLLVREAKVRWKKGWGPVLLLGAAYGILEEGVALSTLFNPGAGPVGSLGVYGHWLGVNWVWLVGILPVHMIYSISVPILLLGLALPETAGRPFLTGRKLPVAIAVLAVDVLALFLLITLAEKFWMGAPILAGSFAAIAVLVFSAHRVRADVLHAKSEAPKAGAKKMAALGVAFYPSVLLTESLIKGAGAPAMVDFCCAFAVQGAFLVYVLRVGGSTENGRNLAAFAFGLVIPIAVFGALAEASLPVILLADAVMVAFFVRLLRMTTPQAADDYSAEFNAAEGFPHIWRRRTAPPPPRVRPEPSLGSSGSTPSVP